MSRNRFFVPDFDVGRSLPCETIPLSHEKTSFVFPRPTSPLAGKIVALLILAGLGPWTARSSAADLIFAAFPFSVGADETLDAFGGVISNNRVVRDLRSRHRYLDAHGKFVARP